MDPRRRPGGVPAWHFGRRPALTAPTTREDDMADTAYVVLILAGFVACSLVLRALRSDGENR